MYPSLEIEGTAGFERWIIITVDGEADEEVQTAIMEWLQDQKEIRYPGNRFTVHFTLRDQMYCLGETTNGDWERLPSEK